MRANLHLLSIGLVTTLGLTNHSRADEPVRNPNAAVTADRGVGVAQSNVAVAQTLRTGDIIGLAVLNKNGEKLGKIDDLVVDLKTGDVRYAALSFGGFAGLGSKLFAVPWEAMTFVFGSAGNQNDRHVVFDVTKDQLDNAPGFDSSHWPDVADTKWHGTIDKHYNIQRQPEPGENANAGSAKIVYETVFRASKIKGMDVRNEANENLGSVDDLVIDCAKGDVKYMALSFGSIFTGGNKLFAVPLSAFTLTHANNKAMLTLHVNKDALKDAPGFDKDHWPNTATANWSKDVDAFYQRTATRPASSRQ